MKLKPMLAETLEDSSQLIFPVLVSPKLDGIRCLIKDGVALSRSLKPIPNRSVQEWAQLHADTLEGWDGELLVGEHDHEVFRRTTSAVMRIEGRPDFAFHIFDRWNKPALPYRQRMLGFVSAPRCFEVTSEVVLNPYMLQGFEEFWLGQGYEGLMVRSLDGAYKYGRSTLKEGLLLKVKRFKDAEATVIGWQERQHNENVATTDALGHTDRSSHKAGMRNAGDLGALVVQDNATGATFNIGSGFTAEQRVALWKEQGKLMGRLVKYKHFPLGAVDKPRFPTFVGFRHEDDT